MLLMAKRANRHFFLFGKYSLALLLPKKWLTELGVKQGSVAHLEYDATKKRITVQLTALSSKNPAPTSGEPPATKNANEEADWQPIPQL